MAFDQKPSTWFGAGLSLASSQLKFNTATHADPKALPAVTDAEADPTTGDVRKLMYGMAQAMQEAWNNVDVADRPAKMTLTRSTFEDGDGNFVRHFTFQFTLDGTLLDVIAE